MPFDIIFELADDRQRILLEESTLLGVGNADLFYDRLFARNLRAVAPVASRFYPLPTLFAFLSNQACASDLSPRTSCGSCWNSHVAFAIAKGAVELRLSRRNSRHRRDRLATPMSNTVKNHIQELIDRETPGLNTKNPDLFLATIHPDMVWPWPPTSHDHDPLRWRFVLGRFNKKRWRQYFQALFDQYELAHNNRNTVKIEHLR